MPKGTNSSKKKKVPLDTSKNLLISNMFNKAITECKDTIKCDYCKLLMKSCLFQDHINTKCLVKMKNNKETKLNDECDPDVIFVSEVVSPQNENKKVKISYKDNFKVELNQLELKKEIETTECTPTKGSITTTTESIFSIFANVEERMRYTPVKTESVNTIVESSKNKSFETKEEAAIKAADEGSLIINFVDDNECFDRDKKLNEIQESNIFTPKKQNFARKSTSACKYKQHLKENVIEIQIDSTPSIPGEDLIIKSGDIIDEIENDAIKNTLVCYVLNNFINAIDYVFENQHFIYLLDENDLHIVNSFHKLNDECKKLYVRLFQRKFKWIQNSNMNYENISNNLETHLDELKNQSFLIDENSIETYEEITDLLKLPQLKQLVKQFHIVNAQGFTRRVDYINAIIKHFKTQKRLNFTNKTIVENDSLVNAKYMAYCKGLLGKCYKLDKNIRDVFVRILMLYSLTSTHHMDQKSLDSGQQQLFQILMVNMGKLKYMNYSTRLERKIYENREAFINYQIALDLEFELIDLIENKEYEKAHAEFYEKIFRFKKIIKDEKIRNYDILLPKYLRRFLANSIYCKILSLFSSEILQKMKFYKESNEIFEFLLFQQDLYLLDSRHHWYERLAINYETHLKDPYKAMEILEIALRDKINVRKAGRLSLYQRAFKMSQIKRYEKIEDLAERLKVICKNEFYSIEEAPIVNIEANLLQPEILPGRKTIFVQNSSQFENNSKNLEICSVEQIALSHYLKNGFTNGKHGETSSIMIIFGLIFWEILFDCNVPNVFIDRFQTVPLDLNTDDFYSSRKEAIDGKVQELRENDIDYLFSQVEAIWKKHEGTQCSLVNWNLFENLEELKGLIVCFSNEKIASLCEYIAKNYRYCRSGGPDLIIWSLDSNDVKFVEVKGPGDKLSYKQIVWLDFLQKIAISCEVCYVKGTCSKRLRGQE